MKKLLLILLIPMIGFGQSFDFSDIKKINSEKTFKILALENLYSLYTKVTDDDRKQQYAYQDFETWNDGKEGSCSSWLEWSRKYKLFSMSFSLYNEDTKKIFEKITSQIKSECEVYDILTGIYIVEGVRIIEGVNLYTDIGQEHLCYTCPNSKYKGKITFYIKNNFGYIETVNFIK